jgi:hypothetical protein
VKRALSKRFASWTSWLVVLRVIGLAKAAAAERRVTRAAVRNMSVVFEAIRCGKLCKL